MNKTVGFFISIKRTGRLRDSMVIPNRQEKNKPDQSEIITSQIGPAFNEIQIFILLSYPQDR